MLPRSQLPSALDDAALMLVRADRSSMMGAKGVWAGMNRDRRGREDGLRWISSACGVDRQISRSSVCRQLVIRKQREADVDGVHDLVFDRPVEGGPVQTPDLVALISAEDLAGLIDERQRVKLSKGRREER